MNKVRTRLGKLIWTTDTLPSSVSLVLYAASNVAGIIFTRDNCTLNVCELIPYAAYWWGWALLWITFASLKIWRLFDDSDRPRIALSINVMGVALCSGWTAIIAVSRWPNWASSGDVVLALAATWVCARTATAAAGMRWGDHAD